MNMKRPEKWKVTLPLKIMYYLGIVKLYHFGTSGDGTGFVNGIFRKWHPLTWLILASTIIPCAIYGEKISDVVPFDMHEFYKRPENLYWVTRKDFE